MELSSRINLQGKGIYTIPDASRLSRVSPRRIRRWLNKENESHWRGELPPIDEKYALGFLDLQEVRFIDAFLKAGITWPVMRKVCRAARKRYETEHPFSTRRFVTDGTHIIEELATEARNEDDYEEFLQSQRIFRPVIQPLLKELEFATDDRLIRWWPLGAQRQVVLDPKRQFGQPITANTGIATEVLNAAVKAGNSIEDIADWYEIEPTAIQDSIDFETSLVA